MQVDVSTKQLKTLKGTVADLQKQVKESKKALQNQDWAALFTVLKEQMSDFLKVKFESMYSASNIVEIVKPKSLTDRLGSAMPKLLIREIMSQVTSLKYEL